MGRKAYAANADSPIVLDIEGGSAQLDVDRYSFRDSGDGSVPRTLIEDSGQLPASSDLGSASALA